MMTAEQLKASIMMLAIEGKLVKHNPADGTGEEQLRKIQEIRRKKIQNGELKKGKPIPIITEDEYPFEIPTSWKFVRMDDLITVISGVSYKKGDVCKTGLRILRGGNIQNMKVIPDEDDVFLPQDYSDDLKQVKIGDVLIVASTGSKAVIGKPGYVNTELPNTMIGAFLRICRPVDIQCAEYLKIIFESEYYRKHIRDLAQGTNINNVKEEYITGMIVPLPPLEEQKRIVAKIEELMPFVEQYAKASTRLNTLNASFPDQIKKSILQQAVMGKLVPQDPNDEPASMLLKKIAEEKQKLIKEGKIKKQKALPAITEDEIPFDIPESWKWVRLECVTKSITDGDHQAPPQTETGIPFLVISNVSSGFMDFSNTRHVPKEYFEKLSADRKAVKGDILFTVTGSYGIPMKVETEQEFCFQRHIALIKPMIDANFLVMLLKSPLVKDQCDRVATGTAQKTVGLGSLRNILVPIPPKNEQIRILETLKYIIPLAENLN